MTTADTKFWKNVPLAQMNDRQWESLCDGCGKCCLVKLQNDQTNEIHYTSLACKLLDVETCRCRHYQARKKLVPDCLILRPLTKGLVNILPATCAYKLLFNGEELPDWHPLITGDINSTNKAGRSVADKVISEDLVHDDDLENFIID